MHDLQDLLDPIFRRSFDEANAKPMLLAFERHAGRIVHVKIDAESVWAFGRRRFPPKASRVLKAVDYPIDLNPVRAEPPSNRASIPLRCCVNP